MSPYAPAPPAVRIPDSQDLGPDPEPLGLRAEGLLQRCAARTAVKVRIPVSGTHDFGRRSTRQVRGFH